MRRLSGAMDDEAGALAGDEVANRRTIPNIKVLVPVSRESRNQVLDYRLDRGGWSEQPGSGVVVNAHDIPAFAAQGAHRPSQSGRQTRLPMPSCVALPGSRQLLALEAQRAEKRFTDRRHHLENSSKSVLAIRKTRQASGRARPAAYLRAESVDSLRSPTSEGTATLASNTSTCAPARALSLKIMMEVTSCKFGIGRATSIGSWLFTSESLVRAMIPLRP